MRTVSFDRMVESGACDKSVARFKRLFGEEIEITPNLMRRIGTFFDWDCAATKLLSEEQQIVYEKLVTPIAAKYDRDGNFRDYLRRAAMAWAAAYNAGGDHGK